jgi:hypothetical protein
MGFTALVAGGLGAAGSIGSALIGSNASKNAAAAQVQAQQMALAQQMQLYQQGLGTQKNYFDTAQGALTPAINAGQGALTNLANLLTPGTSASTLAQMPGFAFAQQYGTMAAQNALSAKTGPSAGPLATAISQYNQGLAGNQYFQTVSALQNLTNTGANAATSLGGIFGSAGNAALGQSGVQGNLVGNTLGNIGNAQAAGTLGVSNALQGGLTSGSNALSTSALLGGFGQNGAQGLYAGLSNPGQFNNVPATSLTDAQAMGYGIANNLNP